jgi:ABC-type multidrug transport system ATPase subunit
MKILLTDVGKRFNRDWIFRHLTYEFSSSISYAITGPNGSGKSTLLQLIAGAIEASEGSMKYEILSAKPDSNHDDLKSTNHYTNRSGSKEIFQQISLAAPYLELVEEMTAFEFLEFHHNFKPILAGEDTTSALYHVGLESARNKQVRYFSSGMKQRLKLGQAIFSDTPVLLLDEPCTNLDEAGIHLYHQLINKYCVNRLVIVSSNDSVEYDFCKNRISVTDYKT